MKYKITTQVTIEVFTYQDADEEIPDYTCYTSLQEMKDDLKFKWSFAKNKINLMTMRDIKKGVSL